MFLRPAAEWFPGGLYDTKYMATTLGSEGGQLLQDTSLGGLFDVLVQVSSQIFKIHEQCQLGRTVRLWQLLQDTSLGGLFDVLVQVSGQFSRVDVNPQEM